MLKKWKTISVNISLDHENNNMALLKARRGIKYKGTMKELFM